MAQIARSQYAFYIIAPKDPSEAIIELSSSLDEYEKLGDISLWTYNNLRIASIYLDSGDIHKAQQAIELASHRLFEVKETIITAYFYRVLSRFLADVKRYDESIKNSFKSAELFGKMGLAKEKATSLRQAVSTYELLGNRDEAYALSLKVIDILDKALDFLVLS